MHKFKVDEDGYVHFTLKEMLDDKLMGIFFDTLCEYCLSEKIESKECKNCGAPSRHKRNEYK